MKKVIGILVVIMVLAVASSAFAQDPGSKLFRGLINTATGFLEFPITVYKTSVNDGYPKGLTYGLARGLVNGVYRTLVGLYEIVTFPIPAPAGYESIMDPETIFSGETLESANPSMRSDFRPLSSELETSNK